VKLRNLDRWYSQVAEGKTTGGPTAFTARHTEGKVLNLPSLQIHLVTKLTSGDWNANAHLMKSQKVRGEKKGLHRDGSGKVKYPLKRKKKFKP